MSEQKHTPMAAKSGREAMPKTELLRLMRLLSAIESWGLSQRNPMPDYLHEDLSSVQEAIEKAILEPDAVPPNA